MQAIEQIGGNIENQSNIVVNNILTKMLHYCDK